MDRLRRATPRTPRPYRRRLLRWTVRSLAALLIFVFLAIGGGWLWLRSSLPRLDGTIVLAGLSSPVSIDRDAYGIPYIRAQTEQDAAFALGFVHAQDRLAQMELMRRLGSGRLSELIGASTVAVDRKMRTLGLPDLAEGDLASLTPSVRAMLDAYAAGVNAFLGSRSGALPPEFYLLWSEPEPWTAADSLRWGRLMALQLTGNLGDELLRAGLVGRLAPDKIEALWPPDPPGAPISITEQATPPLGGPRDGLRGGLAAPRRALLDALRPLAGDPADGSNEWVVAGTRTTTGKPILANDPHLSLTLPNHWYLVRIDLPDGVRAGATAPGVPFLVLGHNGNVAWGLTTTHGDGADLFIERLAPGAPGRYVTPEGDAAIETRSETIRVRRGDDVPLVVRRTRHGPIVSDIYGSASDFGPDKVAALAHVGLAAGDINATALFGANRADSVAGFRDAMKAFRAPQQNVVVADRAGSIALEMPGLIPLRRSGDGLLPTIGWDGRGDWTGFVPFEARPHSENPPPGFIVNANNKLVGDDWPYPIAHDWPDPYRAARIVAVLEANAKSSLEDSSRLALDTVSLGADAALEALLTAAADSERARRAMAMLRAWDRKMDRNRPEPLIYAAWVREAMRAVFADELGAAFDGWWTDRPRLLQRTAEDPSWCDDTGTTEGESCPQRFAAALETALDRLERDYGPDPAAWRWGDAHVARFDHMLFGRIPYLRDLLAVTIETDGGNDTVNRGGMAMGREDAPFQHVHGAGYRGVYDLADLDRSLFIQAVGQSGNPFSPHYADLVPLWRDGRYLRLVTPAPPAHSLRLEPAERPQ